MQVVLFVENKHSLLVVDRIHCSGFHEIFPWSFSKSVQNYKNYLNYRLNLSPKCKKIYIFEPIRHSVRVLLYMIGTRLASTLHAS